MKTKKVGKWLTKPDLTFNLEQFGKTDNVLFITGLYGAGKSFTAENLAHQYQATHLRQDWLTWSHEYNSPESRFFVQLFQQKFPETRAYFANKAWGQVSHAAMQQYRHNYDLMMLEYAQTHPEQLFIYEGSEIFKSLASLDFLPGRPLIIKRTSVRKSFLNLKRRDRGKIGLKDSLALWRQYRDYYLKNYRVLNRFIEAMTIKKATV